jgi:hypothetical protein
MLNQSTVVLARELLIMKVKSIVLYTLFIFSNNIQAFAEDWQLTPEDWQTTLKYEFPIVETFDHYHDWVGEALNNQCANYISNPNTQPQHAILDQVSDYIRSHCYYDRTSTAQRPEAIYNYGTKGVTGKSLRLNWPGNGGAGNQEMSSVKFYFGDGTETSGYNELYIFFSMWMSKDRFPTGVENYTSSGRGDAYIKEGETPLYTNSGKWVAVNMGYANEKQWSDDKIETNPCRWGWNEIHFHTRINGGIPKISMRAFGSATHSGVVVGDVDITPYLDKRIWVELYLKRESKPNGTDGAVRVKFFIPNETTTPTEVTVLNISEINLISDYGVEGCSKDQPGIPLSRVNNMKFNRLSFESNQRVNAGTGHGDVYWAGGNKYNSVGQKIGEMQCDWYVDDLIININPIAETYFNLYEKISVPQANSPKIINMNKIIN